MFKKLVVNLLKGIFNTFRYKAAYMDIKNRQFIVEQIERHKDDYIFKKYNIFVNWWWQLCVLIVLNEDELEIANNNENLEDAIFYDKMNEINRYITDTLLLGDLLIPYVKKIIKNNVRAYTIKYKHYYNIISKWWVLKNIVAWVLIIYFGLYFLQNML